MTKVIRLGEYSMAVVLPAPWCKRNGIKPGAKVELIFSAEGSAFSGLLDPIDIYPAAEPDEAYGIKPGPGRKHPDDEPGQED
jgi:bifunctional DNA-binding transcriptional regulator/antitoxin component of YhaV-PrlF toxin-antitoxin module